MDISSIGPSLTQMLDTTSSQKAAQVQDNFESVLKNLQDQKESGTTISKEEDETLLNACKEMENYFLSSIFKQMKASTTWGESLIEKGDYEEMFEDYLTDAQCKEMVDAGGIGLAQMLYKQMKNS